MNFRGTFEYALDAKSRLTVPAKFRSSLAAGVVLTLSPAMEGGARSLSIWPAADYDSFAKDALKGLNPISSRARALQHALFGNSWDIDPDSAHRLMIPAPAREYAGLTKDAVITGSGQFLEVWDKAAHAAYNESLLARLPEIAASFDDAG